MVEAGECKVASHTTKFDVIFALEAAEFGRVSIVQCKTAGCEGIGVGGEVETAQYVSVGIISRVDDFRTSK